MLKRFDGKGKYNFPTGTHYEGELKDGMFHGKGTLHFENGGKYEATWVEGISIEVFRPSVDGNCESQSFVSTVMVCFFAYLRENTYFQTVWSLPRKTGPTATATTDDFTPRFVMDSNRRVDRS